MGNFQQHVLYNSLVLLLVANIVIFILTENSFLSIFLVGIFFIIGGIMPDIDLSHSKWETKYLFVIGFPTSITISFLLIVTKKYDLETLIVSEWAIYIALPILVIWFALMGAFWIINKYSTHWGKMHSLVADGVLSYMVFYIALTLELDSILSRYLAIGFGAGYLLHLIIDQAYHIIQCLIVALY